MMMRGDNSMKRISRVRFPPRDRNHGQQMDDGVATATTTAAPMRMMMKRRNEAEHAAPAVIVEENSGLEHCQEDAFPVKNDPNNARNNHHEHVKDTDDDGMEAQLRWTMHALVRVIKHHLHVPLVVQQALGTIMAIIVDRRTMHGS